jgi:acyl-coenzyme A synthetase/AMP-(fatty) acid ligase
VLTFHVQRQQSLSVQRQHFVNINVDRLVGAEHHDTVTIVDTWWQTETVWIAISPLWGVTAAKHEEDNELVPGCR